MYVYICLYKNGTARFLHENCSSGLYRSTSLSYRPCKYLSVLIQQTPQNYNYNHQRYRNTIISYLTINERELLTHIVFLRKIHSGVYAIRFTIASNSNQIFVDPRNFTIIIFFL